MAPTITPGTALEMLEAKLDAAQPGIEHFTRYREGMHDLRYATAKFRQAFGGMFREFADNWCELIVEAPVERLRVQGFRMGEDVEADDVAWAMWQQNDMDTTSVMVHREAITTGCAYWMVEPPGPGDEFARITPEHGSQCAVLTDPSNPRRRLAALKKWVDIDGYAYANLFMPDQIYRYRSTGKARGGGRTQWTNRGPVERNPIGVVPIIPVLNAPDMFGGGRSDLRNAIPLQDAINKTILDMLVASEFAAYRQRVVIGVEAPTGPDGKALPNADIAMSMSKLLTFSSSDAKIAEFAATDLSNYTTALEPLVHHLAGQTRTPPHYLLGQMVNVSGDALKAAESGLTARTREKHTPLGGGHETAIAVGFLASGDTERGAITRTETIWSNPEFRNFGELVDGLVKLKALNIPDEMLWEQAGYTPTEIARIKELGALDTMLTPPPALPVPVAPTDATGAPVAPDQVAPSTPLPGTPPASAPAP